MLRFKISFFRSDLKIALAATTILLGTCSLVACGGGGTSGPSADFQIKLAPENVLVGQGLKVEALVTLSPVNGFSGSVSISVSKLPSGVTVKPSTFTLSAGPGQKIAVGAATNAPPVSTSIVLQATSGNLMRQATVPLSVVIPVSGAHGPGRTRYLRTNALYDPNLLQYAPPHFTVYDPAHRRFFVSNPYLNEIEVFDAKQELQVAVIPVPQAWGLDVSPMDGSLWAASWLGDIYHIDTGALKVMKRYPGPSIGPGGGYGATEVFVLADGRLALLKKAGGDGFVGAEIWDPVSNTVDLGPGGTLCFAGPGRSLFAVSGDRSRILMAGLNASALGEFICSYDPSTKQATIGVFQPYTDLSWVLPSPDGTRIFVTTAVEGVAVFDARTVQLLGRIQGSGSNVDLPNDATGAVLSLDGKNLYLVDTYTGAAAVFNTQSLTQTGWLGSFTVTDLQKTLAIAAIDETGLAAGPIGHGVGFLDTSHVLPVEPTELLVGVPTPATGQQTGGTSLIHFISALVTDSATLSQVYLGNVAGENALFDTNPAVNTSQVTSPPSSQAGPVDLTVVMSDGAIGIGPEAFSYGPTILEVVPNAATAEGGQTGAIIGYGFGQNPGDVQITVGGQAAAVTALHSYPPISPYPFPTQGVEFTIPPGAAGSFADVTVTNGFGSATATGAFHYTAAAQPFSVADSLQSGIYDARRDLYYFAGQSQIQVFSNSDRSWHTPISLAGTSSTSQLFALSQSPDGTKLAVSDFGGQAIFVLNPDQPNSAQRFPMPPDSQGPSIIAPSGLAITNSGIVYFVTADISGTGTPGFHKLVTTSGVISDLGELQSGGGDGLTRVLLSPDGTRVYCSFEGAPFWLDPTTDQMHFSQTTASNSGGLPDLAVSSDGSTVVADGFLTDFLLNPKTVPLYVDWETWLPFATTGQKLNANGSLMYQPLEDGIDVLSVETGRLLYRVQISTHILDVYDSLVVIPEATRWLNYVDGNRFG